MSAPALGKPWILRRSADLVLLAAATLWLVPYGWMVLTSLKPLDELVASPASLPRAPTLAAYAEVLRVVPVASQLGLTVLMAAVIAGVQTLLALPAGYALAKLRFRGQTLCFALVLATLLLPLQLRFAPIFSMLARVGLVDTFAGLVLPFAVSALGTFLVRQALLSVPDSLIEAARLDGASERWIVFGLLAPLLRPTLAAFFLFSFIHHYNDYFWPLVLTTEDTLRTLPLGVMLLREQGTGVRWHVLMAGNVLLGAPALLLFAFVQRQLIRVAAHRPR